MAWTVEFLLTAQRQMAKLDRSTQRRIVDVREPLYHKADAVIDTVGISVEESLDRLKGAVQK